MAEPIKNSPGKPDDERAKMMRVLIPAGGIALVVILIAVIASMTGSEKKMSDGSDGSADDPKLQHLGGMKYRDLKEGQGAPCVPGSKVKVHYTGWLTDGTVFDSSKDRGQPIEFSLNGVIQGWTIGIPEMKPGGIRKLVIPPDMAYGNQRKDKIPPGSTLIFEVELLEFTPPPNVTTGPGKPMSDASNGGTDDTGLKDIGDGLKIREVKEGSGEPVKPGSSVTIHYTGWLPDGSVFDTSKKGAGHPATFALSGLIPGWQKGIPGMKPGGIRKLVIPPSLGYGSQDKGDIPPNSTLIFEVELIK